MDREKMMLAIGIGKPESLPAFAIPEGMDVSTFEDGEEKEVVAKVRKDGDNFTLVEVNGIALSKPESQEEEWDDEEKYEDEAADAATTASEQDNFAGEARAMGLV